MPWIKVGEWIVNTDDVSSLHFTETRDGPIVHVYTRSGSASSWQKGGFSTTGEEALALWRWFAARSEDVVADPLPAGQAAGARRRVPSSHNGPNPEAR
jgi:hypothetical protein